MDDEENWDGQNITIDINKSMLTLANKKCNLTHGMTFTIYNDGEKSIGLVVDGVKSGTWHFMRSNASIYYKNYSELKSNEPTAM